MNESIPASSVVRHFPEVVLRRAERTWDGVRTESIVAQRAAPDFRLCTDHHMIMVPLRSTTVQADDEIDGGPRFHGMRQVRNMTIVPAHHTLRGWSDGPSEVPYLMIDIDPAYVDRVLENDLEAGHCEILPRISIGDAGLHDLCLRMKAECEQPGAASEQLGGALALAMTIELLRRHSTLARPVLADRGGLGPRRMRLLDAYIAEHLDQPIGLEQMAAMVGLSRYHFSRLFSRSYGSPPLRYVLLQRMERAKLLLSEGKLSIKEISFACGYANRSHFGAAFKDVTGMTPRDYVARDCGGRVFRAG